MAVTQHGHNVAVNLSKNGRVTFKPDLAGNFSPCITVCCIYFISVTTKQLFFFLRKAENLFVKVI